jgi:Spy/CpxP family protein refolding chaperone
MLRVSIVGLVPSAIFAFALCACGDAAQGPSQATQEPEIQTRAPTRGSSLVADTSPEAVTPFEKRLIVEALGEVALDADLRAAFDTMAAAAKPRYAVTHRARQELFETIAAQVTRGTIDRAALQPKIDALNTCIADEDLANRAAIATVYGKLTKTQVGALTSASARRLRISRGGERGGWSRALGLSSEQRDQIRARMAPLSSSASEERMAQNGGRRLLRMMSFLETAVPILTPEQRAIASNIVLAKVETTVRPAARATEL